jgi:hypothetical protein
MNVWIRKLMRRKGSVKGGYDRRSLMGRRHYFGKEEELLEGGRLYVGGDYFSGGGILFYCFLVSLHMVS